MKDTYLELSSAVDDDYLEPQGWTKSTSDIACVACVLFDLAFQSVTLQQSFQEQNLS